MSEVKHLLEELNLVHGREAWHGPGLEKLLEGISAGLAAKKPASGLHSIWELVLHIGAWENVFSDRIEGHAKTEPDEGDFPPIHGTDEKSWKEAREYLNETHQRLINVISKLTDSDLSKKVPGRDFDIAYMLHGIVRHHVYHAGQIGLLKRLLAS